MARRVLVLPALTLLIGSALGQLDLGPVQSTNQVDAPRQSNLQQGGYLPPIEPAGAQANPVIATTPRPPGPTHHGRDLCTDPFHSFLCSSLKPRKQFTGNLPSQNIIGANSFVAPSKVLAPPLNDIYEPPSTTTKRPTTTTTRRPTTVTTRRPTTTTPRPTTTTRRPTTTTRRPTTTTTTTTERPVEPAPSNDNRAYLPPDESIAPAAASQDVAIAPPDAPEANHHHHGPHHHGRDLCSDPFHAFLCQPLKPRKRITGDLPNGLQGQNSFLVPKKVPLEPLISPEPSNEVDRIYLPPSTTTTRRPTTAAPTTTIRFRPEPSNEVDRFYLPPVSPEPSNEVRVFQTTTTRRPTTTTPRPTTTTTRRSTTTTRRPTPTTTIRFRPEPSNEIDRIYLPPVATRRTTTQPPTTAIRFRPQPSNEVQRLARPTTSAPEYLPPEIPQPSNIDSRIEPAPAQDSPTVVQPDDHHHHHGSHGFRDICSDPFHSFLCVSPKPRVRITGALPASLRGAATNVQETKVLKPAPSPLNRIIVAPLPPSTTTTTTTTTTAKPVQPAESRDPQPSVLKPESTNNNPVVGYDYPKPQNPLPLPSQGYDYPKPKEPLVLPAKGYDYPVPDLKLTLPTDVKLSVVGYDYPKPSSPLPLPSTGYNYPRPSTQLPLPSTGYNYPKPENKLPLPSENNPSAGYDYPRPTTQLPTTGYNYPPPSSQFPFNYPTSKSSLPQKSTRRQPLESRQKPQTTLGKFSQVSQPEKPARKSSNSLPDSLNEARDRLKQVANIGTQNQSSDLIAVNELEFTNGGLPFKFGDRLKKRQPKRQLPT